MIVVYEAANSVEAHMIVHLLVQSDIDAQIDGEYLQGAMGELPAAGNVRVRVSPEDSDEAKKIIAEWESIQPKEGPDSRPETASQKASYFLAGAVIASAVLFTLFRYPGDSSGIDSNGDGLLDETYHYQGQLIKKVEADRNRDGEIDYVFNYGLDGIISEGLGDNDFNGTFEDTTKYRNGNPVSTQIDSNADGKVDYVLGYEDGVLVQAEFLDTATGKTRKKQHFRLGKLVEDEWDSNRDGNYDRKTTYDEYEEPAL
jgi:hypothetical protein